MGSGNFWKTRAELEFRVDAKGDGFKQLITNMGYRFKSGTNIVNATDDSGQPATDPVLLAKDGTKLAAGATPYLLEFVEYPSSDFDQLNIPDNIFNRP